MMEEYGSVLVIIGVSVLLAGVVLSLSMWVVPRSVYVEKVSVYECGFDPFGLPRIPFSVKFFLVGILFLIFDLEVSFLYPWAVCLGHLSTASVWLV